MAAAASPNSELKDTTYEAFIGVLSILSILNIALVYLARSDNVDTVVEIMNAILSAIFFADFSFRILTAESKSRYFFREFGWADLVASIPLPQVKILRLFRVFRAYRLGAEYGVANMLRNFWAHRAQSALLAVLLFIILLLEFGSMAMVWAEENKDGANITSGGDAVWWAYVTITTVGYGDQFPVSDVGRVIGVLVMTGGVALFGVLTGFLANVFLSPGKSEEAEETAKTPVRGSDPRSMLAALQAMLDEQEQATARLRARISEIEQLL